jgi:hypothetical protein
MIMNRSKIKPSKIDDIERLVDLLERLGAIALYLHTDMNHHAIARRLGMGIDSYFEILSMATIWRDVSYSPFHGDTKKRTL